MRTSSCKAKGRRAVLEVAELLGKYAPDLKPGDLMIPTGSVPGADIAMSPAAREKYPFSIEVKCQESLNVWAALKQAQSHADKEIKAGRFTVPLLFFRRNHSKLQVCLDAEDFLKLVT